MDEEADWEKTRDRMKAEGDKRFKAEQARMRALGILAKPYRTRVVQVEAMQYDLENCRKLHEWLQLPHYDEGSCSDGILLPGGRLTAKPGDWIVRTDIGALFVYSNEEFWDRFESVDPPGPDPYEE